MTYERSTFDLSGTVATPRRFSFFGRLSVQISKALEGAFLPFRRWVNVAFRDRNAAVTRNLLIVKASAPASLNLVKSV